MQKPEKEQHYQKIKSALDSCCGRLLLSIKLPWLVTAVIYSCYDQLLL